MKYICKYYSIKEHKEISTSEKNKFLILDDKEVYHLGASLKDLGKKWFAFSKLEIKSVEGMVEQISNLILRS